MRFSSVKVLVVLLFLVLFQGGSFLSKVSAYYTNMSASVVVGQSDFTSDTTGGTSTNFANSFIRGLFVDSRGRMIVSDFGNNRVLIWNQVPTTNGKAADIVLGQPDFTSNTANNGGRSSQSMSGPYGVYSDGDRLFVLDRGNARVLIWSTFPTQNQQAANVVVGQSNFTGITTTCDAQHINTTDPSGSVWVSNNKLLVSTGNGQRRVLIWNTVPTTNGTSADVVLGQTNMTTCSSTSTPTQSSLNSPRGMMVDPYGRLFVSDLSSANRVLMWNSVPTTNNAPADIVIGQPDFTSNIGRTTADGLISAFGVYSNGERLFISDGNNNRVLIFNKIPTSNGASADIVLGQADFTSSTLYSPSVSSLGSPQAIFEHQDKLFVAMSGGHRVLIFNNVVQSPGLSLSNSPESKEGGLLRLSGSTIASDPYVLSSVEYSVNGGDWHRASADDGSFNEREEAFYFEFDPEENRPKDSSGNVIEGYSVRVRSTNNNTDKVDSLFYFTPFRTDGIEEGVAGYPTFRFKVHRNQGELHQNLDHYRIEVKRDSGEWQVIQDNIPVNFNTRKFDIENRQREKYFSWDTKDGEYETDDFLASYSDDSSTVTVRSKNTQLFGSYVWRVAAVDKVGHTQNSEEQKIYVKGTVQSLDNSFPFAILNISGVGNPFLNSFNLLGAKSSYTTKSTTPTFFGIAWSGAEVKLKFIKQNCSSDCEKTYRTTGNEASRFGINVPTGDLQNGETYQVSPSVMLGDRYNELPRFMLKMGK